MIEPHRVLDNLSHKAEAAIRIQRQVHGQSLSELNSRANLTTPSRALARPRPHRHMLRIRAPTSIRTCLVSVHPWLTVAAGHAEHSNKSSRAAGMNRVLEA